MRIVLFVVIACLTACGQDAPDLVRRGAGPPPPLLIRAVDVLDVKTGRIDRGRDVLVQDGRIAAFGLGGQLKAPYDAEEIDGSGATLLPGLVDMHGHIMASPEAPWAGSGFPNTDANLQSFLFAGVTTILDPHDWSGESAERRARVASGALLGPTIYTADLGITGTGSHPVAFVRAVSPWWLGWYAAPRSAQQAGTPEEARAAVETIAGNGADFVKVIVDRIPLDSPRIEAAVLDAAVAEAKQRGLRTVAHVGSFEDARDAGRAGVAAWVHCVYKERLDDAQVAELAAFGIPMAPTLAVFDSYATTLAENREATPLEKQVATAEVLSAFNDIPDGEKSIEVFRPLLESLAGLRQALRDNVRRLHGAGVVILAGSDPQGGVFPGPGMHRELRLLAESGLTPAEAIRAATLDPARFLTGEDDPDFGLVELGKRADLLLVNGDPTADLAATEDVRAVILGGARLERIPLGGER